MDTDGGPDRGEVQPQDMAARPRTLVDLGDDRTIAFKQAGRGRDVLAIHGTLMTCDEMWLGPGPALARHYRVTAVDRPGHGMSRRQRFVDASPWRQAELIHEAARRLGLERPVVIGHSYGGTVALAYAQQFPADVAGVVALAPLCRPEPRIEQVLFGPRGLPGWGSWLAAGASATTDRLLLPLLRRAIFLPQVVPEIFDAHFPTALTDTADALAIEGEDSLALAPAFLRMAQLWSSLRVPIHFLGGTADLVVNNALNGLIASSLTPSADYSWIVGAGHMLHHYRPDDIVAATHRMVRARKR